MERTANKNVQHHNNRLNIVHEKNALYQLFIPVAGNLWLRNHSWQSFCKCLQEVMITVRLQLWCHGYNYGEKGKWHRSLNVLTWWSKKWYIWSLQTEWDSNETAGMDITVKVKKPAYVYLGSIKSQVDIHPFSSVGFFFFHSFFFPLNTSTPQNKRLQKCTCWTSFWIS